MTSDEKLLLAVSQFLTSYGIDTADKFNSLTHYLKSQGVFSIDDLKKD